MTRRSKELNNADDRLDEVTYLTPVQKDVLVEEFEDFWDEGHELRVCVRILNTERGL